jgi:hypothetical protein
MRRPRDSTAEEKQTLALKHSPAPGLAGEAMAPVLEPASMRPADVLALQRTAGNHAVSTMLAEAAGGQARRDQSVGGPAGAMGGLKPSALAKEENDRSVIGGQVNRTFGETLGDMARPIGVGLGNIVGGVTGALTGVSISSTDVTAATWSPNGNFQWDVGFSTTGTSGWIVQEIVNTYRAEDNTGASVVPAHTPHYWEAWAVDASSTISPSVGAINDMWSRPDLGANTKGHWSMRGKVHFTTTDPTTQGFAAGNAPDAGILLSSTAEPAGLGIARLHRYAQGTWDSTGPGAPVHTGSAGP